MPEPIESQHTTTHMVLYPLFSPYPVVSTRVYNNMNIYQNVIDMFATALGGFGKEGPKGNPTELSPASKRK